MSRIIPTIGRVMHYWPHKDERDKQPWAAHVAYVHNEDMVNLMVIAPNGIATSRTSVPIVQPGSPHTAGDIAYVEWMDFQRGQAAKYDAEAKARNEPR